MSLHNRRRGRPKTTRADFDFGTPELQKKRQALIQKGQDESLSESLLGLFLAKGLISQKYYDAGMRYYELGYTYEPQLCLGLGHRQSILTNLGQPLSQRSYTPENNNINKRDESLALKWKAATNALKAGGLKPLTLVIHILFSGIDPKENGERFLKQMRPKDLLDLRDGLLALVRYFKI